MARYSWDALAEKYQGWRAPVAAVSIDGQPLLDREWRLQSLQCSLSTGMEASVCTLVLGNVYDQANSKFTCENMLTLGSSVRISLGYIKASLIFVGYLYEIEYELGETASVSLRCMDVKGAMMGNSFITEETTFRKAIRAMFSGPQARGYSLLCSAPAMENLPELDRMVSFDTSGLDDFGFLRRTTELWGLECFVRQGNLLLRKKPPSQTSVVEFSPGDFHALSAVFSSSGYVRTVRVRGGTDDERDGEKNGPLPRQKIRIHWLRLEARQLGCWTGLQNFMCPASRTAKEQKNGQKENCAAGHNREMSVCPCKVCQICSLGIISICGGSALK